MQKANVDVLILSLRLSMSSKMPIVTSKLLNRKWNGKIGELFFNRPKINTKSSGHKMMNKLKMTHNFRKCGNNLAEIRFPQKEMLM